MAVYRDNANRRILVSLKYPPRDWTRVPHDGSKWVDHWTSGTVCEWSEIAGSPQGFPSSQLCWLWSWKEDLQRAWNRDRRAVWDQVELSHCWHEGLVTIPVKALLRRGCNDQGSREGHQCSEITLIGECRFHISNPSGDWKRVLHDGKQTGGPLDQWNCVWMQRDCRLLFETSITLLFGT
jgi:hypothetical protein